MKLHFKRKILTNQIFYKTDLKLNEEGPKIIILKSNISAMPLRYQVSIFLRSSRIINSSGQRSSENSCRIRIGLISWFWWDGDHRSKFQDHVFALGRQDILSQKRLQSCYQERRHAYGAVSPTSQINSKYVEYIPISSVESFRNIFNGRPESHIIFQSQGWKIHKKPDLKIWKTKRLNFSDILTGIWKSIILSHH